MRQKPQKPITRAQKRARQAKYFPANTKPEPRPYADHFGVNHGGVLMALEHQKQGDPKPKSWIHEPGSLCDAPPGVNRAALYSVLTD